MERLVQLIYISCASRLFGHEELLAILDSCIRHNEPQKVTGMLLYANGSFMQVLEGNEAAVEETMSRIRRDDRHNDIYELCCGPIAAREFGSWSMGFRTLTPSDALVWPGYAPFFEHGFEVEKIVGKPDIAVEMLRAFYEQNQR